MLINEIFTKDIFRPINGVVKADQQDETIVWQELDEYVVTKELSVHLNDLLKKYLEAKDNPHDPTITGRMGVWVSGFFGSGKSHFIKILSYLFDNRLATNPDDDSEKNAIDFFDSKIKDPMMLGDLKRTCQIDTDVALFNIDSKAQDAEGRTAIRSVFWKVFNEMQGFCGDSLPLAEMERYLVRKGKYDEFKEVFKDIYGSAWEDERDAYTLIKDDIVEAFAKVLGRTKEATEEWFDKSEETVNPSIETFCKRVKEYLDSKGPQHRLVFLVDEIGQFIGSNTQMMLNLQTLVEDLGRICEGRAWVFVTSQEDIDAVLGDLKSTKANDFSKIQGRFNTRLSLSSANTDEVIQARLLEKTAPAEKALQALFSTKGDIINNQLTFTHDSANMKLYTDGKSFADHYPFAPFHFQLVQKIFESIRKAGATGLHLSRGERSMLDAFQSAAKNVSTKEIGSLIPLYEFFPCIESFLDTAVKRSIDQAKENSSLEPFDIQLLQSLFLIRYVDIIKPKVDNLVTLCIDEVDTDRISLRRKIEEGLQRLEQQHLVNRNGDLYFFLTNEEREVSKEIDKIDITSAEETSLLGDIIFDDILKGSTKHRYTPYRKDYPFNRICDDHFHSGKGNEELSVECITPLNDDYNMYNSGKCIMHSGAHEGHVVIKLPDEKELADEVARFIQTDKFIKHKSDSAASPTLKDILRNRADENRERKVRIHSMLDAMILSAELYIMGHQQTISGGTASAAIGKGFDYLIQNFYSKFGYLSKVHSSPQEVLTEIKHILNVDDVGHQQLKLFVEKNEAQDIKEVNTYIALMTSSNKRIVLADLVAHFLKRPFGWSEWETVLLVTKVFSAGKINLSIGDDKFKAGEAYIPLSKAANWKTVKIIQKEIISSADLQKARNIAKDVFGTIGPEGQDNLAKFLKEKLGNWKDTLVSYKSLADTGKYPGKQEIDHCNQIVTELVTIADAYELIKAVIQKKDDLLDASDDLHDLNDFHKNQKTTWEDLTQAVSRFNVNRTILCKDNVVEKALDRMDKILQADQPYNMIKEVVGLIATVETVNDALVLEHQQLANSEIDHKIAKVKKLLDDKKSNTATRNNALYQLQKTKDQLTTEDSIPNIKYQLSEVDDYLAEAIDLVEEEASKDIKGDKPSPPPKPVKKIKVSIYSHKTYLETEEDVDQFLGKIGDELKNAIKSNHRVMVQ